MTKWRFAWAAAGWGFMAAAWGGSLFIGGDNVVTGMLLLGAGLVLITTALYLARFSGEQAAPRRRVPDTLKDFVPRE
jgi:hypothetical protein